MDKCSQKDSREGLLIVEKAIPERRNRELQTNEVDGECVSLCL